ncbi:MAG TPA: nicotinate-nicotinamide nucleotide adenylyltransferase [Candidatus Paceibacterota bacterium]
MKKVLIFPGAFSPPHYGHISTIETALKNNNFDELWVVPSGKRVDKIIPTSHEDRRNLGNIFVDFVSEKTNIPVLLITDELDDIDGRHTYEILKWIKSRPNIEFTQLVGLDALLTIQKNDNDGEFERDKFLTIINRPGCVLPADFTHGSNITIISDEMIGISSTKIRNMIGAGDVGYKVLVPPGIAEYIDTHNLY